MTPPPESPRYFFNTHRQRVDAVLRDAAGRRVFRKLASFAEAGLDAQGLPLPGTADADRDALLGPRWRAARDALAAQAVRAEATGTISTLWAAFIRAAAADRAPGTIALYHATRRAYLAANRDHPLAELSLHHVDRLKSHGKEHGLAPHTVNQRLNGLRAFLRWAHDRDELTRLPRFPNLPAPRRQPSVLTAAELQALIARITRLARHGDPRQRQHYRHHLRFLMVGLGCGLRRGEILNLRWDQIDLGAALLTVRITRTFRTKEHREKTVPIPGFLQGFLRREAAGTPAAERWLLDNGRGQRAYPGPQGAHSLTTAFRKHLAAIGAGGRGIKPTHGQRALFATELHRRGADAYTIQQLMGHSSIAVTEHYLADPSAAKRRAIDTLTLPRVPRQALAAAPSGASSARKRVSRPVSAGRKALK